MYSDDDLKAAESALQYQNMAQQRGYDEVVSKKPAVDNMALVDEIMRKGTNEQRMLIQAKKPELYNQWKMDKESRVKAAGQFLEAAGPDGLEILKANKPKTYADYQESQQGWLKKTGKFLKNLVIGEHEDYDEVLSSVAGAVDTEYANPAQATKMIREAATKPQLGFGPPKIDKKFQTIKFKGNDKFGTPLYTLDEDLNLLTGTFKAGTPFYLNKPGASINDMAELRRQLPEMVISATAAPKGFLWSVLVGMAGAAATSAQRQIATEIAAPTDRPTGEKVLTTIGRAGAEGLVSGIADVGLAPFAWAADAAMGKLAKKVTGADSGVREIVDENTGRVIRTEPTGTVAAPPPRFVDYETGQMTIEGRQWLQNEGVDVETLIPEVFLEMVNLSKDPQHLELGQQFRTALARSVNNDPFLSEVVGKADPAYQKLLEATGKLLSSGSELGETARVRLGNNLKALKEAADVYNGEPPKRIVEQQADVFPFLAEVEAVDRKRASDMYDLALRGAVDQGAGGTPLNAGGIQAALDEARANYGGSEQFNGYLNKLQEKLYAYGALDTTDTIDAAILKETARVKDTTEAAKRRLYNTQDRKAITAEATALKREVQAELAEINALIKAREAGSKAVRKEAFKADEAVLRAQKRGVSTKELLDIKRDLEAYLQRYKTFQGKELDIAAREILDATDRKAGAQYTKDQIEEAKQQALINQKLTQMDEMTALKLRQVEAKHRNNAAAKREFNSFTAEAAARLHRDINSIPVPEGGKGIRRAVQNSVFDSFKTAPNDRLTGMYRNAVNNWARYKKRYATNSILARLSARDVKGSAGAAEIKSAGIIRELKGADIADLKHMMEGLRRAKAVGTDQSRVKAHKVEKILTQNVWLDLWDGFFAAGEVADTYTIENFKSAVGAWGGGNYMAGKNHLDAILPKPQRDFLNTVELLLDSQTRRPINSTTKDGTVGKIQLLLDKMNNSMWLATKTPGLAGLMTTYRFGAAAKEQALERTAGKQLLYPSDVMDSRFKAYMHDPLQYQALMEFGSKDVHFENVSGLKRARGFKDVPYKKLSPDEKVRFHEAYADAYPHMSEWAVRQIGRTARREPMREAGEAVITDTEGN
jgi:hypothetical protein